MGNRGIISIPVHTDASGGHSSTEIICSTVYYAGRMALLQTDVWEWDYLTDVSDWKCQIVNGFMTIFREEQRLLYITK